MSGTGSPFFKGPDWTPEQGRRELKAFFITYIGLFAVVGAICWALS